MCLGDGQITLLPCRGFWPSVNITPKDYFHFFCCFSQDPMVRRSNEGKNRYIGKMYGFAENHEKGDGEKKRVKKKKKKCIRAMGELVSRIFRETL